MGERFLGLDLKIINEPVNVNSKKTKIWSEVAFYSTATLSLAGAVSLVKLGVMSYSALAFWPATLITGVSLIAWARMRKNAEY